VSRHVEAQIKAAYQEHGRAMMAYATRLLGDQDAATDVVQEALVRLWRNLDVLTNGKGSVRGWLLTVVRNLVIDRAKARAARPPEVPELPDKPPVQPDHADAVIDRIDAAGTSRVVREALGKLSPKHREVLEQIYFHQLKYDEIALVLGVPPGTVKSRAFYASKEMRELLDRERERLDREPVQWERSLR
jgi:RNA polymerase sigma-70 factor, ECF subfamily